MTRKWTVISNAEEALEVILALPKAERARLFDLMARELSLARYMLPPTPKQLGFEVSADFEGTPHNRPQSALRQRCFAVMHWVPIRKI